MAKKGCRCKHVECEECPEWIFTFADLVMLMMGFFVILWVLKPAPGKQSAGQADDYVVKIEAGVRGAFGYVPDPHSNDPVDKQMLIDAMTRMHPPGEGKSGRSEKDPNGPKGDESDVQNIRQSRHSTEGGKMLFDRNSDTLDDGSKQELAQIAELIRGHRNLVIVKGHTSLDDLPDNATPRDKMNLSLKRAQAAEAFLISQGVDPQILRVQGCSTFEPISRGSYTPDAQSQNRRVEVEATATLVEEMQDAEPSAPVVPATQPGAP